MKDDMTFHSMGLIFNSFWANAMTRFVSILRMMVAESNLNASMSVWKLWTHQLLRSVQLKSCLVLDLTRKCKNRKHEIFLVAGG